MMIEERELSSYTKGDESYVFALFIALRLRL